MNEHEIGQRVRACRESVGWSQSRLAKAVGGGWRQTTVARIESGQQQMRLSDAIRCAGAFRMGLDEFVGTHLLPCDCVAVEDALRAALASMRTNA